MTFSECSNNMARAIIRFDKTIQYVTGKSFISDLLHNKLIKSI